VEAFAVRSDRALICPSCGAKEVRVRKCGDEVERLFSCGALTRQPIGSILSIGIKPCHELAAHSNQSV
jgi:excinuclease UvrABC helicase subunit UvrB